VLRFMLRSILITAGPTREPIDPVRYIGNRSSGRMGAALAEAALSAGHQVTLVVGPICVPIPQAARRIDVQTAAQMHAAVLREFPQHDLLIMAAAVADFRPVSVSERKLVRGGNLIIECEPTPDIVAVAGATKRPDQRTIGFHLDVMIDLDRAREKLARKKLDLIVCNPAQTMESDAIESVLLWPDEKSERLGPRSKSDFAVMLIDRACSLLDR
jgi:phosphopantothenoylcysteine decarboxylase / phosphopantothenate---cysteine ligase